MIKRNSFILANCTTNTVPNFYLFDYKCFACLLTSSMCMIFRQRCQGIRHLDGYVIEVLLKTENTENAKKHHADKKKNIIFVVLKAYEV